jgi:hypothetical protein
VRQQQQQKKMESMRVNRMPKTTTWYLNFCESRLQIHIVRMLWQRIFDELLDQQLVSRNALIGRN